MQLEEVAVDIERCFGTQITGESGTSWDRIVLGGGCVQTVAYKAS